jgi:hypothetical protein
MAFNVTEFRANLVGDGARGNLFQVTLVFPTIANSTVAGQKLSFMARTSELPGSQVSTLPLYYFGREIKFPGQRTFNQWTLRIINDEDFVIRDGFEQWMNAINSHAGNVRAAGAVGSTGYSVDATVDQYGKAGDVIKSYKFVGVFPTNLSDISLDWGNDAIEEFDVTFDYQYWEANTTS